MPIRFYVALVILALVIACPAFASRVVPNVIDSADSLVARTVPDSVAHAATNSPSKGLDRRNEPGILDFITNLPMDWRDWAVQDIKFRYWPQIALVTVSTAAMIVYDNQLWKPFEKEYNRSNSFHTAADLFVDIGDGRFQFGLAGVALGYGLIAGDKRATRTASQICEVILASGGVVQLLKHVTGRESPIDITTNPTGRWDWFPNQIDYLYHTSHYDAFPSGHLTTALATLTVIANNYPEQKWILPVGYAACAGLAAGLVSQSVHWWSDYPLAIALGIGFGDLISPSPNAIDSVTEPADKKAMGSIESTFDHLIAAATFVPKYEPDGAGIGMTIRF